MKEDGGGISKKVNKIELMTSMDWDAVLSTIHDQETIICTYGNPDTSYNPYLKKHLPHMSNITIVNGFAPNYATAKAYVHKIEMINPNVKIYVNDNTHAKALLIAPDEVYLTSQNVGDSSWFQATVHITDNDVYDFYKNNVVKYTEGGMPRTSRELNRLKYLAPEKQEKLKSLKDLQPCTPMKLTSANCKFFKMTNWNQKFNNIRNSNFIIATYSLPDLNYTVKTVNKLLSYNNTVTLIINSKFENAARSVERYVNDLSFKYYCREDLHAKMVLCSNYSVWMGSHNFGNSTWFETLLQIKNNKKAYMFYLDELTQYMTKDGLAFEC